jgi:hypothetical protein
VIVDDDHSGSRRHGIHASSAAFAACADRCIGQRYDNCG